MYKKALLLYFLTFLFVILPINAQEKKGQFLGAKQTTNPEWFKESFLDIKEDIEELSEENKRLIIYVHQNNCPYCYLFINKNLKDKKTKDKINKHFEIVEINMFGDKEVTDIDDESYSEKEFAIKHKIQFTPTLIFYSENAKEILRLNGYVNIDKFNKALDYIKDKKETKISYNNYLLQKENTAKNSLIKDSDLFIDSINFIRDKNSKKMAIFFETTNCKECETLHNTQLQDKKTRGMLKKLDLYQLDINSQKGIITPQKLITKTKNWCEDLNIINSPTIIFFDEKGKEIIRVDAMLKKFHFQTVIDYVISNEYKKEKEFQRYLTKRANSIREKGIDVNIWE